MSERQEGPERATCHDHDQYYWVDEGCPICTLLAEKQALEAERDRLAQEVEEARRAVNSKALAAYDHIHEQMDADDPWSWSDCIAYLRAEGWNVDETWTYEVFCAYATANALHDLRDARAALRTETGGE